MVTRILNRAYSDLCTPFNLTITNYNANFGQNCKNIATNLGIRSYSTLNSGPISDLNDNITLNLAKCLLNEKKSLISITLQL